MEFWGVEVKPGQSLKCEPGEDKLIHLSQAALGESKKGPENVPLYVKLNNQKLVIGTLSSDKCAQFSYDLVFEKEFELSHTSKNTSVYFCGYKTDIPDDEPGDDFPEFDSEEEEEELQLGQQANGKPLGLASAKAQDEKLKSKSKKQEAAPKVVKDDDDDDDSDDESDESGDDKDMADAMADSDEDDDDDDEDDESSEDEDEETPQKPASGKKRPAESASKTPVQEKKAKLVSPAGQKTGGNSKKGGHVATPHPAKQGAKTPANNDKAKQQQSPKSGSGSVSCKSCSKTFGSENGLQAHTKAKHSAGAK